MIGWYIHHQGSGHLHRATAVVNAAARRGLSVTGLSSLPQPQDWSGAAWLQLDRDDTGLRSAATAGAATGTTSTAATSTRATGQEPVDPTAAGALHWVPRHHPGLLRRSAELTAWLETARPELLVVDVSVEVALLTRLHGIPVVTVALPGDRTDPAHRLGYAVSDRVVGMWPGQAEDMVRGADDVIALGGLSRFATPAHDAASPGSTGPAAPLHVVVLSGRGGGAVQPGSITQLRRALPAAEVTVLGGEGAWETDPWPHLQRADLVLTAAGQNSIAEVAASRTPALVMALERPHQEQQHMLAALERGPWPVIRMPDPEDDEAWAQAVAQSLQLDGAEWSSWCDGGAADRFAALLSDLVEAIGPDAGVSS